MSRILIGLAAVWVFAGGFGPTTGSACSNGSLQRDCKPCKRPDGSLNHSPNVTGLVLDKTQLRLKDPQIPPPDEPVRLPEMIVNVTTNADDVENDVLYYYYVVSGGRLVGSGSNIQWDLNGVSPGSYTIDARVDDGCGVCGKTMKQAVLVIGKTPLLAATPKPATAKVPSAAAVNSQSTPAKPATNPAVSASTQASVRPRTAVSGPTSSTVSSPTSTKASTAPAAATAVPCSCPKIMISDPERSDSDLMFTTKIFDNPVTNRLTYIWTISGGSVVSQEGRSIRVKPGVLGGSVSVIVNGLDPRCGCPNQASKTF